MRYPLDTIVPESKLLHIGSGTHYTDGWCNVDSDHNNRVDYYAEANNLPFPDNFFIKLYMGHFLEHIPFQDMPRIFKELRRVTTEDCLICVVGPDMTRAVEQNQPQWLLEAIVEHDPPPGGHAWTATGALTYQVLLDNGMSAIEVPVATVKMPAWPNSAPNAEWQCAFFAEWAS